ncbi:MAG: hypothetical protein VB140_09240 [Burkholderia sp.]
MQQRHSRINIANGVSKNWICYTFYASFLTLRSPSFRCASLHSL